MSSFKCHWRVWLAAHQKLPPPWAETVVAVAEVGVRGVSSGSYSALRGSLRGSEARGWAPE